MSTEIRAKYDLNLYRGDSYGWRFILWEDVNQTIPLDLTGATITSEIRDKPAGNKIIPLSCTVTAAGTIDVILNAALCQSCPVKGGWDLEIVFPDGQVLTPIGGEVKVTADYTNSVLV